MEVNLKHFRARRGGGGVSVEWRGGCRVEESVMGEGVKEGQAIIGGSEDFHPQWRPN